MATTELVTAQSVFVHLPNPNVDQSASTFDFIRNHHGMMRGYVLTNDFTTVSAQDAIGDVQSYDPRALVLVDNNHVQADPDRLVELVMNDALLTPDLISVNALSGFDALASAAEHTAAQFPNITLVANTVPALLSRDRAEKLFASGTAGQVIRFATEAAAAGIKMVICPSECVKPLRESAETEELEIMADCQSDPNGVSSSLKVHDAHKAGAVYLNVGSDLTSLRHA